VSDPEDPQRALAEKYHALVEAISALIAQEEAKSAEHAEKARAYRLELARIRGEKEPLNIRVDSGTVNAMNASAILTPNAQRSATRILYKDVRFVLAMKENGEAGKPGATVREVAALLTKHFKKNFHVNTVQAWYVALGKKAHRDCPLAVREFLREFYGKYTSGDHRGAWRVPLDSWPLESSR
jgi:hypothetical protein